MRYVSLLFRTSWIIRRQQTRSLPHVCIVGSGPSAFYAAQFILRHHVSAQVDMYEKLPTPFGLVRYGVAPDHPEVKNVINTFTEVARNPRFRFFGNVCIGKDIRLQELQLAYGAVILAYGATLDRRLNIPGEDLTGVFSAREFVGWYNGTPTDKQIHPNLDCETVAIVGMGNVAIDIARILLSDPNRLKSTDIPDSVLNALSSSRIKRVILVARRGLLQAAFTLKEIRELSRLDNISFQFLPLDLCQSTFGSDKAMDELLESLPRPRRRLMKFLTDLIINQTSVTRDHSVFTVKHCDLRFLRSPVRIHSKSDRLEVDKLELAVTRLQGPTVLDQEAIVIPDLPTEFLECGLVIRSIGYRSIRIDPCLPFDEKRGVILCKDQFGRVADPPENSGNLCPMYASGWAKRGPVGVIVDTAVDARRTAEVVLVDLAEAELQSKSYVINRTGAVSITSLLTERGIRAVSFPDWERVDAFEKLIGKELGKPREKITSVESLLGAAFADPIPRGGSTDS